MYLSIVFSFLVKCMNAIYFKFRIPITITIGALLITTSIVAEEEHDMTYNDNSVNSENEEQVQEHVEGQLLETSALKRWMLSIPFQRIEPGSFLIGSPTDELGRHSDEDQQQVEITRPFEIMETEVTQSQWVHVMGENPSYFQRAEDCDDHIKGMCPNHPVEQVSWEQVQKFIKQLNDSLGLTDCDGTPDSQAGCYRLPTEAEWEYSARAGTELAFSYEDGFFSDLEDYAWYIDNSESRTHKVGTKKPNPNGLYDIHGNVWEWVQDGYVKELPGGTDPLNNPSDSVQRVYRGGSWFENIPHLRSAVRGTKEPLFGSNDIGFRLLRTL